MANVVFNIGESNQNGTLYQADYVIADVDASKPSARPAGSLLVALDTKLLYQSDGTSWFRITTAQSVDFNGETSSGTDNVTVSAGEYFVTVYIQCTTAHVGGGATADTSIDYLDHASTSRTIILTSGTSLEALSNIAYASAPIHVGGSPITVNVTYNGAGTGAYSAHFRIQRMGT